MELPQDSTITYRIISRVPTGQARPEVSIVAATSDASGKKVTLGNPSSSWGQLLDLVKAQQDKKKRLAKGREDRRSCAVTMQNLPAIPARTKMNLKEKVHLAISQRTPFTLPEACENGDPRPNRRVLKPWTTGDQTE